MSDIDKVLNCPMGENDAGAETIKGYLKALLVKVWAEGECFGGKRPFGNSGWEYELYHALAAEGLISADLDDDGDVEDCDTEAANQLILSAINAL